MGDFADSGYEQEDRMNRRARISMARMADECPRVDCESRVKTTSSDGRKTRCDCGMVAIYRAEL